MKTISLLNLKGGVGKTTSAVNIAKGLANKGRKVLLIDTDMQANATSVFISEDKTNSDDYKSFADMLIDKAANPLSYMYPINENLDVIGGDLSIASTELNLRQDFTRPTPEILKKNLEKIKDKYDYCIIDCSPTLSLLTINVILASDQVIIPIKVGKFAVKGFEVTYNNILDIKEGYNVDTNFKVLYTMVNRNNTDREVMDSLPVDKFDTTIRYQAKPVTDSEIKGLLLVDGKDSNVKQDYIDLIEEIDREGKAK